MPISLTSEWVLDPALPDRARIIVAVLQRFGAHNRPTLIRRSEPFGWFADDHDATRAAWVYLLDAGALILHPAGEDHFEVLLAERSRAVPRPKPSIPAKPKRKPKAQPPRTVH